MPNLRPVKSLSERNSIQVLCIAPLTVEDAEAVATLHAHCFERPWSASDFERFTDSPCHLGFTARHDERLAGFVLAGYAAGEAEILTLGVASEHRRRGIALKLIEELCEHLSERGVGVLFLEVAAHDQAARRLYETCGFQIVGRRPAYYQIRDSREDALIMKRSFLGSKK